MIKKKFIFVFIICFIKKINLEKNNFFPSNKKQQFFFH